MSEESKKNFEMKKEIGLRFKQFRKAIKRTQKELADELKVCQSTITNIEKGMIFPGAPFQNYLHNQYNLNINWLYDKSEEMILTPEEKLKSAEFPLLFCHLNENDPKFEQFVELISLMRIPFVEKIILGKLEEIKVFAKKEIESFLEDK